MAFSMVSRGLLRTSREILDRSVTVGAVTVLNGTLDVDIKNPSFSPQKRSASTKPVMQSMVVRELLEKTQNTKALNTSRSYSKKLATAQVSPRREIERCDSDAESDDEFERVRKVISKRSERGDSAFWRRKLRTLHRILDVNRDGVLSFDDFNLLAKRFTDLGHLKPEVSAEFMDVMKHTWEELFGEINPYNLVTAEQFLTDIHHRLNDEDMVKRIGRFLPYVFQAVDYDHTGHLNLEQYKLFFRCLGLTDTDAAISFAVIDKNGDGQLSLKEFVHLGRQFFLTEDDTKISKMFWGPLIDH